MCPSNFSHSNRYYANIVMSIIEHDLSTGSCRKQLVWVRYDDAIFAICTYGEDKLKDFLS